MSGNPVRLQTRTVRIRASRFADVRKSRGQRPSGHLSTVSPSSARLPNSGTFESFTKAALTVISGIGASAAEVTSREPEPKRRTPVVGKSRTLLRRWACLNLSAESYRQRRRPGESRGRSKRDGPTLIDRSMRCPYFSRMNPVPMDSPAADTGDWRCSLMVSVETLPQYENASILRD